VPRRQRARISRGHPVIEHGCDQKNNSGSDGDVVQSIERAAYDRSRQMAGWKKSGRKGGGSEYECEKDQSAQPDHERQQHEEPEKWHERNYRGDSGNLHRIVIPSGARDLHLAANCRSLALLGMTIRRVFCELSASAQSFDRSKQFIHSPNQRCHLLRCARLFTLILPHP
jgi:hypothetical protein